jgi:hypothetical protein
MNKRGAKGGTILGGVLLIVFVMVSLYGLFSNNICDRLLIIVGLFGLFWLFFGSSILTKIEKSGFIIFLVLTIITLIAWMVLTTTGICISFPSIISSLIPV